jgi:hypothetical protein
LYWIGIFLDGGNIYLLSHDMRGDDMATMKNKPVGFNIDSERERRLFEYAQQQKNFSKYIKELIEREMIKKPESTGIKFRID